VVSDDPAKVVADIKAGSGHDVWLFGGGELFRYLLDAGLVDTVGVALMPVLLGEGIPVLPAGARAELVLSDLKRLPSGIVMLAYSVKGAKAAAPKIRYIKPKR
jgi:dihydrofolate reductase